MARRTLPWLLAFLLLGAVLTRWVSSDEHAVEELIRGLAAGLAVKPEEMPGQRDARVQELLERDVTQDVLVQSVDLPPTGAGKPALLRWARLLGRFDEATLDPSNLDVTVDGRQAEARVDVDFTARAHEDELTERRRVHLNLERSGSPEKWRIRALDIAGRPNDHPEARP